MDLEFVVEKPEVGIALISFNRPEKLNAISFAFIEPFRAQLAELEKDDTIRAVILTGRGRGFCSGHTLDEVEGPAVGIPQQHRAQGSFVSLVAPMQAFPKPIIAAINGPAVGSGFGLALAADTRLASTSARFGNGFIRLGISGGEFGMSYLLPRIVGPTLAFELMLSGRIIDAQEALSARLVSRIVPDEDLLPMAIDLARQMARNSPFGLRMTKHVMWANLQASSLPAAIATENVVQSLCAQTEDQTEAVRAFVEKRAANWKNR